ncbi:MAG: hypothetical protein O3B47_02335 [bacterium]|nr:hypothetical protein [bacterium]
MKKKFLSLSAIMLLTLTLAACGSDDAPAKDDGEKEEVEEVVEEMAVPDPGTVPVDFPTVSVSAKEGDIVYSVKREDLDDAFAAKEDESKYFYFYEGVMVTPGEVESTISIFDEEYVIPNSLIIPVVAGQNAKDGEMVLTSWAGSMTRGYVKEGGTEPKITFLDYFGEIETLEADSFNVISGEFAPGSKMACADDAGDYSLKTVVTVSGDKILTLGWASSLEVEEAGNCKSIPSNPGSSVGDTVWISPVSTFQEGVVTEVDESEGMLMVEYTWIDTEEEKFPYGTVLTEAP